MNPSQINSLKVGQVIISPGGRERIVRSVTKYTEDRYNQRKGQVRSVHVTIMHCSWTGACDTILDRHILKGYKLTRKIMPLRKRIDKEIEMNFRLNKTNRTLTCCDVKGIR